MRRAWAMAPKGDRRRGGEIPAEDLEAVEEVQGLRGIGSPPPLHHCTNLNDRAHVRETAPASISALKFQENFE